jgi:hypothetical protein
MLLQGLRKPKSRRHKDGCQYYDIDSYLREVGMKMGSDFLLKIDLKNDIRWISNENFKKKRLYA